SREALLAAELRIERAVIDHVVAVAAARPRREERRGVDVRDAERLEIGHDARGVVEAELLAELQPVGGERQSHGATAPRSRHRPPTAAMSPAARRPTPARRAGTSQAAAASCRQDWPSAPALRPYRTPIGR